MKCLYCGKKLIEDTDCGDTAGEIFDSNFNRSLQCISTHDNDEKWLVCFDCECYYLIHQCEQNVNEEMCQFLGHSGHFELEDGKVVKTDNINKIRNADQLYDALYGLRAIHTNGNVQYVKKSLVSQISDRLG